MPLNSSGTLSIGGSVVGQSINLQLQRSSTATSNMNETALRSLAGVASGSISLSNFYGKPVFGTSWLVTSLSNLDGPGGSTNMLMYDIACNSNGKYVMITNMNAGAYIIYSNNFGASYANLTSAGANNFWYKCAISANGSIMAAAKRGGQIHISTNSGASFTARAVAQTWVELCMSDNGQYMVGAGLMGGFGKGSYIYNTSNYGVTWTRRADVAGNREINFMNCSSTGQYVIAGEVTGNVYVSSNYGNTFTKYLITNPYNGSKIQPFGCCCSANGQIMYLSDQYGAVMRNSNYGAAGNWSLVTMTSYQMSSITCSADGSKVLVTDDNGVDYVMATTNHFASNVVSATGSDLHPERIQISSDGSTGYLLGTYSSVAKLLV